MVGLMERITIDSSDAVSKTGHRRFLALISCAVKRVSKSVVTRLVSRASLRDDERQVTDSYMSLQTGEVCAPHDPPAHSGEKRNDPRVHDLRLRHDETVTGIRHDLRRHARRRFANTTHGPTCV